jgi:hypothetical protein
VMQKKNLPNGKRNMRCKYVNVIERM